MKKVKTILIIIITMLCIISIEVKAEEIGTIANVNIHNEFTSQVSRLNQSSDLTSTDVSIETPLPFNPVLANYGKGFVIFSFAYYSEKVSATTNYQALISGVSVKSGSQLYACEIGNLEPYTDNTVQYKQATAKCYVNFGSNGWERIRFTTPYLPKGTRLNIVLSRYGTFVGSTTQTSNQDVVNAITNQNTQLNNIRTAIQQQQQAEQQQHNEIMNEDLPQQSRESAIDSTEQQQAEQEINNVIDNMQVEEIDMDLKPDRNALQWIWDTMTNLLNTNEKVFGTFLSVLLVGIVKLTLGR